MRRTQCRWNGEGGRVGETYTVPLERGGGGVRYKQYRWNGECNN